MTFERTLVLSSQIARKKDIGSKPENFVIQLNRPLILPDNKQYGVALLRMQGSYSWHNVEQQYNNNLIKYSTDGGTSWKNILFPNGVYSYSDLNSYIHYVMKENGDVTEVSGEEVYDINISFSLTTFLVYIDLTNGVQLDLVSEQFGNLIGFDVGILTALVQAGNRLPDITRGIDNLYVHCSVVRDTITNGVNGDVLFAFETGQLRRSYSFTFEPINLAYSPVIGNQIDEIRCTLTSTDNNPLDLNGIDVSYVIVIKEMK